MTFRKLAFFMAASALFACDAADPTPSTDSPEAAAPLAQQAVVAPRTRQLALGRAHGCSLDAEISGVLCWGDNTRGQARVPALRSPRFVAAGGDTSCALAASGVICWGDDARGQRFREVAQLPLVRGRARVAVARQGIRFRRAYELVRRRRVHMAVEIDGERPVRAPHDLAIRGLARRRAAAR